MMEPLPAVHAVVDLSADGLGDEAATAILAGLRSLSPAPARVTLALGPERPSGPAPSLEPAWIGDRERSILDVLDDALLAASLEGADLLVLEAAGALDERSLTALQRSLRLDPHFGFALPRVTGYGRRLVHKLDPDLGDPDVALVPQSVIDAAPPFYLVRDRVGPCLLIRAEVVREFGGLDRSFETLRGALLEFVARARETGLRTLVVNRSLVTVPGRSASPAARAAGARDRARLYERFPYYAQIERLWRELPMHEYEGLLGRAMSHSRALQQSLLVDLSNMIASHNGTTEAIRGILKGLAEAGRDWQITLRVSPEVANCHELSDLCPAFQQAWPVPRGRFSVTLTPLQPWSLEDVMGPHRYGLFNYFLMYDTILDDISRGAPLGLERVWAYVARWADGLLYDSEYTMRRMRARFPVASGVDEQVLHLATNPVEYRSREYAEAEEPYVFVVGNDYPHKWMERTVRDLTAAFPYTIFKTLGYTDASLPLVEGLASGSATVDAVERLYAQGRAVVFPSRYEGFGFPVLHGLAHGRTVIARDSELLREVAGLYRGPGRLLTYSTRVELVETLGRVLHDEPVDALALAAALGSGDTPLRWRDVAQRFLSIASERLRKPETSQWSPRQAEIAAADLYRGTG